MSGCNLCHVPLRFGNRSGNNIDVDRIRTGNMTCHSCLPYIIPPRSPNKSSVKSCRHCGDVLVVGENIILNKMNHSDYECQPCVKKKYVPTGGKKGRQPLGLFGEELKKHQHRLKKEERDRKRKVLPQGVYGIFRNGELVYVGESSNMWYRMYNSHFRYNKTHLSKFSCVDKHVTKDNIDEFTWGYLHKSDDLTKRLIIEDQYVSRYVPRYNFPYRDLTDSEYESFKISVEQIDVGPYTLDIDRFSCNKTKLKIDSVHITRIVK